MSAEISQITRYALQHGPKQRKGELTLDFVRVLPDGTMRSGGILLAEATLFDTVTDAVLKVWERATLRNGPANPAAWLYDYQVIQVIIQTTKLPPTVVEDRGGKLCVWKARKDSTEGRYGYLTFGIKPEESATRWTSLDQATVFNGDEPALLALQTSIVFGTRFGRMPMLVKVSQVFDTPEVTYEAKPL